jgi:hypothetical protein
MPHKKENLPEKIFPVCKRPFKWRKKWERDWEMSNTARRHAVRTHVRLQNLQAKTISWPMVKGDVRFHHGVFLDIS